MLRHLKMGPPSPKKTVEFGLVRVNSDKAELIKLLDSLDWPLEPLSNLADILKSKFDDEEDHEAEAPAEDEITAVKNEAAVRSYQYMQLEDKPQGRRNLPNMDPISITKLRPRELASKMQAPRQLLYSVRRDARRKWKLKKSGGAPKLRPLKFDKDRVLLVMTEFVVDHAHNFFRTVDLQNHLEVALDKAPVPSLSTVRRWMKRDLALSFKKVNLRFKQTIFSNDVTTKLKYSWIFFGLFAHDRVPIFLDEFNIFNCSIKRYNWTSKGPSNYWYASSKSNKLHWWIAVTPHRPLNIAIQDHGFKSFEFAKFINETFCQLKISDTKLYDKSILIFDGASIHSTNLVSQELSNHKKSAIILPPYTTEYNNAEIFINIIKSSLDHKIKKSW